MSRGKSVGAGRMLFGILAFVLLAGLSPKPAPHTVEATPAAYQAWRNALVEIGPNLAARGHRGFFGRLRHIERYLKTIPAGANVPAVLYLHDCPGLKIEAVRDVGELAAAGFAVFAPDSFDNRARKPDCVRFDYVAGLNPDAYTQRQSEILVALAEMKKIPWIDSSAIILYGLGEGALAAANYPGHEFRGVVLTGWTCGGAQYPPEVAGLKTPQDTPILALVSRYDPWFDRSGHAGNCGAYMAGRKYAQSIVIENQGLHHITWADDRAREAVRRFVKWLKPPRL